MLKRRRRPPTDALIAATSSSGSSTALLISLGLMVVIFYFLLIRPQRRRAMQQRDLVESLGVGDEVVTIGGMFGTIRAMDDESVTLEVAPGTSVRMMKSAIRGKAYQDEEAETTVPDEEPGETS
jgi:preprotein translocase subunit YajC